MKAPKHRSMDLILSLYTECFLLPYIYPFMSFSDLTDVF